MQLDLNIMTCNLFSHLFQEHHSKINTVLQFWSKNFGVPQPLSFASSSVNRVKRKTPILSNGSIIGYKDKKASSSANKYSSRAMDLFKSSLEESCQDATSRVLNATQLPGYPTPGQNDEAVEGDDSSGELEAEDSESAVDEDDLVFEDFIKEEAEASEGW